MTKDEARGVIRKKRSELSLKWIREKSRSVQRRLLNLSVFTEADIVCCYLSVHGEVQTDLIITQCMEKEKTLCVPAFCRENDRYELALLRKDTPITEGLRKILEPEKKEWISIDKIDLIIVPGLAFDPHGGRIGYGGGNYDRILEEKAVVGLEIVGLAFEFQIFKQVPMNEKDVRVDSVVTEKRVINQDTRYKIQN